ncbi:uncharacterized protein LOC144864146 [Branchiostoma floridae x Branchiostoma japonicum]
MPTATECVCCHEVQQMNVKRQQLVHMMVPVPDCITLHPGIPSVCLDPWGLQCAYYHYRQEQGPFSQGDNHDRLSDDNRQAVGEVAGAMDKGSNDDQPRLPQAGNFGGGSSQGWSFHYPDQVLLEESKGLHRNGAFGPTVYRQDGDARNDRKYILGTIRNAYRQLVRWCWGWLGAKIRVIPACAVNKIRETLPSEEFIGFKYPPLDYIIM